MNDGKKLLHLTIGPVQGFVAQARRTRDLWAGSFLLSYLSGCAMKAVLCGGGRIIFPKVQDDSAKVVDPLLLAIRARDGGPRVSEGPFIGSLPNRFKAEVPEGFDPKVCAEKVRSAWRTIAESVWSRFFNDKADLGNGTRAIWDRQINGFWDIAWCIGEDDSILDRRKNWRNFVPAEEPGDKCAIMGNLQELSGYLRSNSQERVKQEGFWRAVRGAVPRLDLHEDERLCAVALVKRLFPRVGEAAVGWKVPVSFPSTVFMAAVHWVERQILNNPELASEFAALARTELGPDILSEYRTAIRCLEEAASHRPEARELSKLDGNCFFDAALANDRLWPENTEKIRGQWRNMLKIMSAKDGFGPPSPFYAVLLMDGDRLGALLRDFDVEKVSQALAVFSDSVPGIVRAGNGITIYAGGDDVLALLPLEDALATAVELQEAYWRAFPDATPIDQAENRCSLKKRATLSGAIVYAHYHLPLKNVLAEAHRLLNVAKDKTGRDSLAVAVWKNSGPALTWSGPWELVKAKKAKDGQLRRKTIFDELVFRFSNQKDDPSQFSNRFFYKIRERFLIFGGEEDLSFDGSVLESLLTAEYLKSGEIVEGNGVGRSEAGARVKRLLEVCQRSWHDEQGNPHRAKGSLTADGALLVRFLAQKGVDLG